MNDPDMRGFLNHLISVSRDGEEGYRNAAAHVNNSELRSLFESSAKQRAGFVHELQEEVSRLEGSPADGGSFAAAVHRGWLDLKAALTGGAPGAVVAACKTGEDSAVAAYERVVNLANLTGHPRVIVEKQWHAIVEAHRHLQKLKTEIANGSHFQDRD